MKKFVLGHTSEKPGFGPSSLILRCYLFCYTLFYVNAASRLQLFDHHSLLFSQCFCDTLDECPLDALVHQPVIASYFAEAFPES